MWEELAAECSDLPRKGRDYFFLSQKLATHPSSAAVPEVRRLALNRPYLLACIGEAYSAHWGLGAARGGGKHVSASGQRHGKRQL